MSGAAMLSPNSAGGYVRRAAPEPNKRALYVGGLDPRVTEDILKQIFETSGHVLSVKIIPDKNVRYPDIGPLLIPLPPDSPREGVCATQVSNLRLDSSCWGG
jgi:RNA recognition motif-containing protein